MSGNKVIKKEPPQNGHPTSCHQIDNDIIPTETTSSNVVSGDGVLSSSLLEDEDEDEIDEEDEIVREIDVYISPELANSMHLIQFPLQPASHSHQMAPNSNSPVAAPSQQPTRPAPSPHPVSARVKPLHAKLELDYNVPSTSFSNQRQIPAELNLFQRKYSSHNIPMVTHMAMGLFDITGSKIDLIPLHRIMQMRPNFAHVDALYQNDDQGAIETTTQEDEKKASQPIIFKRSESERAAMQRMSSYAYKKSNEDAEEWINLDVHGFGSLAKKEAMKKAHCPQGAMENNLEFLKNGKTGGNPGYVKSLNYLPSTVIEDVVEDFTIDDTGEFIAGNEEPEWKRELTRKVASLLQERGGMPIPYPIIRSRFQSSISDEVLIDAISASAVLVRGNFVLKSSLMALSNMYAEIARDVILVLMIKYGFVQRARLFKAFQKAEDDASVVVTIDVINSLLELMGRKTTNGFEMKVDDDLKMESQFSNIVRSHALYWHLKETQLQKYINLYEDEDDMIDTNELNVVLFRT